MLKCQIIGHLGRDADFTNYHGESVINFTVAHTDKYKDGNGAMINKTTWVNCSWWTDRQNILPYLRKGTQVYIEGVPEARMWKKKDTEENQCGLSCRVYKVELLGSGKKDEGNNQQQQPAPAQQNFTGYQPGSDISQTDDDLPF